MSDHAGVLCNAADVKQALAAARALNETIRQQGIAYSGAPEALKALQWRQTALLSEAVLTALAFYIERGGGSRGARAICAPDGDRVPEARTGVLEDVRFVSERAEDRAEQIHVRFDAGAFVCEARPIRRLNRDDKPFFERDWPDFLTGAIHDPRSLRLTRSRRRYPEVTHTGYSRSGNCSRRRIDDPVASKPESDHYRYRDLEGSLRVGVHKLPMNSPNDVSALERLIDNGRGQSGRDRRADRQDRGEWRRQRLHARLRHAFLFDGAREAPRRLSGRGRETRRLRLVRRHGRRAQPSRDPVHAQRFRKGRRKTACLRPGRDA